ncbi:MAG: hypothetical protein M1826_000705 [Phylliscum demangeonii]|nr:MAG: hypothetical protein M1826_000705 [Phylliscum demangeonii]
MRALELGIVLATAFSPVLGAPLPQIPPPPEAPAASHYVDLPSAAMGAGVAAFTIVAVGGGVIYAGSQATKHQLQTMRQHQADLELELTKKDNEVQALRHDIVAQQAITSIEARKDVAATEERYRQLGARLKEAEADRDALMTSLEGLKNQVQRLFEGDLNHGLLPPDLHLTAQHFAADPEMRRCAVGRYLELSASPAYRIVDPTGYWDSCVDQCLRMLRRNPRLYEHWHVKQATQEAVADHGPNLPDHNNGRKNQFSLHSFPHWMNQARWAVLHPRPEAETSDHVVDDGPDPGAHPPASRKREFSELRSLPGMQPQWKRQKPRYPGGSRALRAFWDNLSKVGLTRHALKELDRRTTVRSLWLRSPRRSAIRRARAALEKRRHPIRATTRHLGHYGTTDLKGLKRFTRHSGRDLSDLRGYPNPIYPPRGHTTSTTTTSASHLISGEDFWLNTEPSPTATDPRSTGCYTRNFAQNLIDNGVYPPGYQYPEGRAAPKPANLGPILQRLAQRRASLSPSKFSEMALEEFRRVHPSMGGGGEKQAITRALFILGGEIPDTRCVSGGVPFRNLDRLTAGALVTGHPDMYDGARAEEVDNRVRRQLKGSIVPCLQFDLPIVPNFFVVAYPHASLGSAMVAIYRAAYDGAFGARAMHRLQSYREANPVYDNSAFTISSTYIGGVLMLYSSHPTAPANATAAAAGDESRPEYHMTLLGAFVVTRDVASFRRGATAFRNARDWAQEQRDTAIRRANQRANGTPPVVDSYPSTEAEPATSTPPEPGSGSESREIEFPSPSQPATATPELSRSSVVTKADSRTEPSADADADADAVAVESPPSSEPLARISLRRPVRSKPPRKRRVLRW